jgi:predicted RNase H-like HicB family nuclease
VPDPKGGFSAELLEFPGCFAEGETANEAYANLEKSASSWIEVALSQGQDIPRPSANYGYSGRLVLRLPRELHRLASQKANRDGVSLNQCFVTAIASWVGADNLYQRLADRLVELKSGFNPRAKRSGALDRVEVNDRPRKFLFDEMD